MFINSIWWILVVYRFTFYMLPSYLFLRMPTRWKHEVFWPLTIKRHRARFRFDASKAFRQMLADSMTEVGQRIIINIDWIVENELDQESGISKLRSNISPPRG